MRKFFKIMFEIIFDILRNIVHFIKNNLRNIAWLIEAIVPYAMYFTAYYVYDERGEFVIGGELFIPIIAYVITYVIRSFANKIGKGYTIPTPNERFTKIDDDGEVSIPYSRTQELLLYVADLEDWMERKGIL